MIIWNYGTRKALAQKEHPAVQLLNECTRCSIKLHLLTQWHALTSHISVGFYHENPVQQFLFRLDYNNLDRTILTHTLFQTYFFAQPILCEICYYFCVMLYITIFTHIYFHHPSDNVGGNRDNSRNINGWGSIIFIGNHYII